MVAGPLLELAPCMSAPLEAVATQRRYPAHSYLFHEGDDAGFVLLVRDGLIRADHTTESGRVALLNLATAGDLIGELAVIDEAPRSATVSTVVASEVWIVGADDFRGLLDHDPAFQRSVVIALVRRLRALSDQLVETSVHCAPTRVAARLIRLAEMVEHASGEAFELRLPITQEELGQWAGLSREGTAKGLAELRDAGIIETGRRRVYVLDQPRLASVAGGTAKG